jgi:hypothetical protein
MLSRSLCSPSSSSEVNPLPLPTSSFPYVSGEHLSSYSGVSQEQFLLRRYPLLSSLQTSALETCVQLQIPPKEVIANSLFTNRWSRPRSSLDALKSLLLSRRSFEPPPDVLLDQLPLFAHSSPGRSILTLTPSLPLYALFLLGMRRQSALLSQSRNLTRQSSTPSTSFRSKAQVCDHA